MRTVEHWIGGKATAGTSTVVTSRWPAVSAPAGASYHFPTSN